MQTKLSIIIVNYKTPQLVRDCLATIYGQERKLSFEIIVVDNHSGDDSREQVLSFFPEVKWIAMSYNAGFARANNEGIRQSAGDTVLLLNSDTLVENNAIADCYTLFSESGYVACGVQLLNSDGSPQISGNYAMTGGLNYLLPLPYLGEFFKWLGTKGRIKKPNLPDSDSTVEVDWINGACLMVKKPAIEKAGLMDEDFFLYAEEAEWCSRLRKVGKLCIFGQCRIIHLQGISANETFGSSGKGYYNLYDRKGLQIMLSNFVRIRKQFGVLWFLLQLAVYLFDIPVFFTGLLFSRLFKGEKSHYTFTQFISYSKNIFFVAGKSRTILRNKPYFYKVL